MYIQKSIKKVNVKCSRVLESALSEWVSSIVVIESLGGKQEIIQELANQLQGLTLKEEVMTTDMANPLLSEQERLDHSNDLVNTMIDNNHSKIYFLSDLVPIAAVQLFLFACVSGLRCVAFVEASGVKDAARSLLKMDATADDLTQFNFINRTALPCPSTVTTFITLRSQSPRSKVVLLARPIKCDLLEYNRLLRSSLISRWKSAGRDFVYTGITSLKDVRPRLRHRLADYKKIPGFSRDEGFGLLNTAHVLEVWVNALVDFKTYIPLFDQAMHSYHGFHYIYQNRGRYDLDHAYSNISSKNKAGSSFVLLTPVLKAVNRSYNSIEKDLARDPLGNNTVQFGTWFIFPKLVGIYAPTLARDRTVERGLDRVRDELFRMGAISKQELVLTKQDLREFYGGVLRGRTIRQAEKNGPGVV